MSEFFGLGKYLRAEAPQCGSFVRFSASVWFFLARVNFFSRNCARTCSELLSFLVERFPRACVNFFQILFLRVVKATLKRDVN